VLSIEEFMTTYFILKRKILKRKSKPYFVRVSKGIIYLTEDPNMSLLFSEPCDALCYKYELLNYGVSIKFKVIDYVFD
jgi:hypothetical protein